MVLAIVVVSKALARNWRIRGRGGLGAAVMELSWKIRNLSKGVHRGGGARGGAAPHWVAYVEQQEGVDLMYN